MLVRLLPQIFTIVLFFPVNQGARHVPLLYMAGVQCIQFVFPPLVFSVAILWQSLFFTCKKVIFPDHLALATFCIIELILCEQAYSMLALSTRLESQSEKSQTTETLAVSELRQNKTLVLAQSGAKLEEWPMSNRKMCRPLEPEEFLK